MTRLETMACNVIVQGLRCGVSTGGLINPGIGEQWRASIAYHGRGERHRWVIALDALFDVCANALGI